MRPFRLLLSLFTCLVLLTLLLYANVPAAEANQAQSPPLAAPKKKGKVRALFSWNAPSSLFPPSAIISLTDDNSTFFLARPAAFGPLLPAKGLSGPLWVGSGFSDDALGHGSFVAGLDGELGCSDVPGWNEGDGQTVSHIPHGIDTKRKSIADTLGSPGDTKQRRNKDDAPGSDAEYDAPSRPALSQNDGTDDYLHHMPGDSDAFQAPKMASEHADIQSLQEGAEIAGKVVLLSRGGCGFLEKVKWVQRRGGNALIVGDNIRGGALITMYAHGDTSNVTIPALFTSHTTAHLLSSLIPSSDLVVDGLTLGEAAKLVASRKKTEKGDKSKEASKPNTAEKLVHTNANSKATQTTLAKSKGQKLHVAPSSPRNDGAKAKEQDDDGWLHSLFSLFASENEKEEGTDSRRPPSSGGLEWVLVEDFVDDKPKKSKPLGKSINAPNGKHSKLTPSNADDFVIGVQDWRDKDLLPQQTSISQNKLSGDKRKPGTGNGPLKGGSILPGSGEYRSSESSSDGQDGSSPGGSHHGWFSALLWGRSNDDRASSKRDDDVTEHPNFSKSSMDAEWKDESEPALNDPAHHDGLWVTLTPTTMSSSPFFDTLLVLVVSPLVTLTVVYALLLLRSRIRRRRWRAPKSVVDRLPVRTYQTIPSDNSSSANTPVIPSSTTPLLSHHHRARSPGSLSRPRSHTTPEVPAQTSSSYPSHHHARSPSPETEKREAGLAEWRRRYGGRQKECVVCLEEYVDGISRVMSLPCGHEFHAECITPWLTTRRRTCPICKGDVVRSLQRFSPNNASSSLTTRPAFLTSRSSSSSASSLFSTASSSPTRRSVTPGFTALTSPPHPDLGLGLALDHSDADDDDNDDRSLDALADADAVLPTARELSTRRQQQQGRGIVDETSENDDSDEYDVERAQSRAGSGGGGEVVAVLEGMWRRVRSAAAEVAAVGWRVGSAAAAGRSGSRGRGRRRREEDFDRDR